MHSTHLSFQGFQGKVGSKGDIVSRSFTPLNRTVTSVSHILLCVVPRLHADTYFPQKILSVSLNLLIFLPRVTPAWRDWLVRKVKR